MERLNRKAQENGVILLTKERLEAERKAVEAAKGIVADFQRIVVSDGISPNLLKWKGIEATQKLAESISQ